MHVKAVSNKSKNSRHLLSSDITIVKNRMKKKKIIKTNIARDVAFVRTTIFPHQELVCIEKVIDD